MAIDNGVPKNMFKDLGDYFTRGSIGIIPKHYTLEKEYSNILHDV